MDADSLFPSKYLSAVDVEPPITLTIFGVTQESMKGHDGEEILKPVVSFRESKKSMVMNVTNKNILKGLFGNDTDDWINQKVTLCSEMVNAFGEMKPSVRVKAADIAFDRIKFLARYEKLFARAQELGVDNMDSFVLPTDASDSTLIELGKLLNSEVKAAEAFL
jgi:hypothetical protein